MVFVGVTVPLLLFGAYFLQIDTNHSQNGTPKLSKNEKKAGKRTKKKKKKKKNKKSNSTTSTSSVASDAKIVKRVKQSKKRSRIEAALANPFPSDFDIDEARRKKRWDQFTGTPIDDSSLKVSERGKQLQNVQVGWKRPPQFCRCRKPIGKTQEGKRTWLYSDETGDGISSAVESMQVEDIEQGSVGDCYFLSAICAAISHSPNVADDLILETYEEHGIYGVSLYLDNKWRMIWVDDCFPCYLPHRSKKWKPLFARSKDGKEIWPMVVEKAFAKYHGSYENISGGLISDAFVALTGGQGQMFAVQRIPEHHREMLWRFLVTKCGQDEILLGAGSMSGESDKMHGLIGGHAYTILNAIQENELRLLQIRNPWGEEHWQGPWSDRSSTWDSDQGRILRQKLHLERNIHDGVFYIAFTDFLTLFQSVDCCILPGDMVSQRPRKIYR